MLTMEAPIARRTPNNAGSAVTPMMMNAVRPTPLSLDEIREANVVEFANLLSTPSAAVSKDGNSDASASSQTDRVRTQLLSLISPQVSGQEVVLIVPSLDIQVPNEGGGAAGPLPRVGETSHQPHEVEQQQQQQQQQADVGGQTSWTKSTCSYASSAIATNISESFSRLVGSRMRAWTLLLLRHSLSTGDSGSRDRLLGILAASLKVKSTETRFLTLQLPASAADQPKEKHVILPLLFEATVTIFGQDKQSEAIKLRAPGTISANFAPDGIKLVEIVLDGNALLSCMVERTRLLVLKAVASATKTQVPSATIPVPLISSSAASPHVLSTDEKPPAAAAAKMLLPPTAPNQVATAANLSGFRSALTLSSPGLQKARSSALRLNSVLHGTKISPSSMDHDHDAGGASALGMRKVRSVRWNTPGQIPSLAAGSALAPAPKKSRRVQTAAKLKSFKSFGRPHGGDFGSGPRNATFGEFGSLQNCWGRDGKMSHHPMPMQSLAYGASQHQVWTGEAPKAERNATFDLLNNSARQGGGGSSGGSGYNIHLSYSSNSPTSSSSSMPRTATVLESLLLKNSMLKHSATLGKKPC